MTRILVIDDEPSICWAIRTLGEKLGHEVREAASAEAGLETVAQFQPDLIFLDVRLPGISGLEAIPRLSELSGGVPIVLITAFGDLETAVDAVRQGVFEYLVKPFAVQQVQHTIRRALQRDEPGQEVAASASARELVGNSPPMQEIFKRVALAAAADAAILVQGESGTGKELVATAIHRYSSRAAGPFVAVNIASLAPSLVESELFGHVRGAFTDAHDTKPGLLQNADGGTLFLDEVAEIPLVTQAKLLRVLEQGEVVPVGASQGLRINFRIVCATHRDLLSCVKAGTFRHDLLFRLSTFRIEIPPLRERAEDIPELATHFLASFAQRSGRKVSITTEAMAELTRRPWYGNVRELRNAVEHAHILARDGVIRAEHLPDELSRDLFDLGGESGRDNVQSNLQAALKLWIETELAEAPEESNLHQRLLTLTETELFRHLLDHFDGQYVAAAKVLGVHRTTVKKKCEELGILSR
ncbi:MAG: sigma-54 dependent transcriptional regulator [Pirellulaceae bacterium]